MFKGKAFTLSEVIVTMGILGILAAMLIPSVVKIKPDAKKIMFKKAYATLERSISEMLGDSATYSSVDTITPGFLNTDTTGITDTIFTNNPANKFCYVFAQKMSTLGVVDGTACPVGGPSGTFTTTDGIKWTIPIPQGFTNTGNYVNIMIDVNGAKGPNCGDPSNSSGYTACTGSNTPDRFYVGVRYDGKIQVVDTNAMPILTDPTKNN